MMTMRLTDCPIDMDIEVERLVCTNQGSVMWKCIFLLTGLNRNTASKNGVMLCMQLSMRCEVDRRGCRHDKMPSLWTVRTCVRPV